MDYKFQQITVHHEKIPALRDLSCEINAGDFILLTGVTGAGKTTFLRLLYLDLLPVIGTLFLNGQDTRTIKKRDFAAIRRKIGIAFQDVKLLENRTIFENVLYPLMAMNYAKKDAERRVLETLSDFGISYVRNKFPHQLSGGEKHLAALARAMVHEPELLIADEPTGHLDATSTKIVAEAIRRVVGRGATVIVASHSQEFIDLLPNARTFVLSDATLEIIEPKMADIEGKSDEKSEEKPEEISAKTSDIEEKLEEKPDEKTDEKLEEKPDKKKR